MRNTVEIFRRVAQSKGLNTNDQGLAYLLRRNGISNMNVLFAPLTLAIYANNFWIFRAIWAKNQQ
jgi:hypothetical protein